MNGGVGFMYPNEYALQWSILIVLYPFITGLVAGAFILASLERVFRVEAVKPTYRLALLTALAFLLDAPLPLQLHLGHPERSPEMYFTPHATSAMAMFGYVYLWYLMAVLVFEIWLDYRRDIVILSQQSKGLLRIVYKIMTLGSSNISERSLHIDEKVGWIVTLIGIPSAFLLHGYVGFIFGSIKANPWWGNVLMPIIFILSAMASGIALCVFNYLVLTWIRRRTVDMRCLDTMAMFLFYAVVVDAAVEGLDWIHRSYAAEEGFQVMQVMIHEKLFYTLNLGQALIGTLLPLLLLGSLQLLRQRVPEIVRRRMIFASAFMILIGVLAMRWNVVMGGQLFSKSFRGVMSYKFEFTGGEGWLMGLFLLILPFIILTVLLRLFLSERLPSSEPGPHGTAVAELR
ncbi:MAG: NrfD/PsrC family molybdoenzyme membrane anchor subunit [Gammaproteobacteria bacterium]